MEFQEVIETVLPPICKKYKIEIQELIGIAYIIFLKSKNRNEKYLYTAIKNSLINYFKREKFYTHCNDNQWKIFQAPDIDLDMQLDVRECLSKLNQYHRDLIELKARGLTLQDIASLCKVSKSTIFNDLEAAKSKLLGVMKCDQ